MTIQEICSKTEYGDYITLAKMIGVNSPDTAKKRFLRGNAEAKTAMERIIEARETLIKTFKKNI